MHLDQGKIRPMSVVANTRVAGGAEVQRLRTLYELLAALSHARDLEAVFRSAIESLLDATEADRAAILLFDDDGVIRFKASQGLSSAYQSAVTGHSPWARGEQAAQPLCVPDVLLDEALTPYQDVLLSENIRALTFIPLALNAGVFGKFMLYYNEPHESTPGELEISQAIAAHVALATGHKQTESASQHLAAIVESSENAIIGKDSKGKITSWNRGAERLFGYTAAEAVGQSVSMLAATDRLDEMPTILSKVLQGNRIENYETRRRHKDGRIIDVALSISPVHDAVGQIVGASKIASDITDRKLAERERAASLLREQEARRTAELLNRVGPRLAAQLESDKLVQEVTDIATSLVEAEFGSFFHNVVNDKGESYMLYTLSGVPREAFEGFPMPRNTEIFAPTFRGEGVVRIDDVTQDPRYGRNPPYHGMPHGHLPVRSYLAAPVIARSGEVLGGLFFGHSLPGKFNETHEAILTGLAAQTAIAMDNARLFEQARWVQAELKRSNEELRRANRDLEIFAYSASHDLQEPLRTIAISAQLVRRGAGHQLSGDESTFLNNIETAAKRMNGLIQDLLAYTRATKYDEGQAPVVDSQRVLKEVLEGLDAVIRDSGAIITTGELPAVSIHETRLAQLLQNLVSNAVKYRSQDAPHVTITATERDGWCVFSVADNGIGIEQEYAERIFGLFKRLHGRDQYPGNGIGLAICQRVVEQYGGRIWLEQSIPGRGSTFCFSVPSRP